MLTKKHVEIISQIQWYVDEIEKFEADIRKANSRITNLKEGIEHYKKEYELLEEV